MVFVSGGDFSAQGWRGVRASIKEGERRVVD